MMKDRILNEMMHWTNALCIIESLLNSEPKTIVSESKLSRVGAVCGFPSTHCTHLVASNQLQKGSNNNQGTKERCT